MLTAGDKLVEALELLRSLEPEITSLNNAEKVSLAEPDHLLDLLQEHRLLPPQDCRLPEVLLVQSAVPRVHQRSRTRR